MIIDAGSVRGEFALTNLRGAPARGVFGHRMNNRCAAPPLAGEEDAQQYYERDHATIEKAGEDAAERRGGSHAYMVPL
jgi:hypothetical protein